MKTNILSLKKFLILPWIAGSFLGSTSLQAQFPTKAPPTLKLTDPLPANLFVELARVVNPSVVNISTTQSARSRRGGGGGRDPLLELFEQFYGAPQRPQENRARPLSLGTGFIIREDGLIVTNAHVVSGADGIFVQLTEDSKKKFEAKLIGSDARTDIALIKIQSETRLPAVSLGNSSEVQVGEWVIAIGNPFNLGHSVTKGIISSIGREISEINRIPLLQTDASINPGNSGGPLLNSRGQVIGVNNAINAAAQGIGFAIPIDEVKRLIPELETRGSIRKGYLGIQMGELDPGTAEELGLQDDEGGVIVVRVEESTPAGKAGLRPYDIILKFQGKAVKGATELMDMVQGTPVGSKAKLLVLRGNKKIDIEVTLGDVPGQSEKPAAALAQDMPKSKGLEAPHKLGFRVSDITADLRRHFDIPSQVQRPMVTEVERGGIAGSAGLRVGDVLLVVNDQEVTNAKEAVASLNKDRNVIRMARDGRLFVLSFSSK